MAEHLPKLTVPEQKRLNMKFGYEQEQTQDEKALAASAVAEAPVRTKQKPVRTL